MENQQKRGRNKTYCETGFLAVVVPLIAFAIYVTVVSFDLFPVDTSKKQNPAVYISFYLPSLVLLIFSFFALRDSFLLRVKKNDVVQWNALHREKTRIDDLRFAYFAACESPEDGRPYSACAVNVKRKVKGNYYIFFTTVPLNGYSFMPLHLARERYDSKIRAFAGYSSTAATRLLKEFRGIVYLPEGVYADNPDDLTNLQCPAQIVRLKASEVAETNEIIPDESLTSSSPRWIPCFSVGFRTMLASVGLLLLGGAIACFYFWSTQNVALRALAFLFLFDFLIFLLDFVWCQSRFIKIGQDGIALRSVFGRRSCKKEEIKRIEHSRSQNAIFKCYWSLSGGQKALNLGNSKEVSESLKKWGYPAIEEKR